jgi:hypothetical protein
LFGFGGLAQLRVAYKYIVAALIMYFLVSGFSIDAPIWLLFITKILFGAVIYPVSLIIMCDSFFLKNVRLILNKLNLG